MVHVQSSRYDHVPWFVTDTGQTDVLLILMAVFLVLIVFMFGVLMLRLHHLPEHIAQKEQKVQYQLVATLGLLAMFTHENLFWIAGLLLAMVDLPDFSGLLGRIASSVERISRRRGSAVRSESPTETNGHHHNGGSKTHHWGKRNTGAQSDNPDQATAILTARPA